MIQMTRRERDSYLVLSSSLVFFVILVFSFMSVSVGQKLLAIVLAILSVAATTMLYMRMKRRWSEGKGASATLLSRIATGDLAFYSRDIDRSVSSSQVAAATRALVLNLERTISRFSQLSADVRAASEQMIEHTRSLTRASAGHLDSMQATAGSVRDIDAAIQAVRRSMENLASSSEETANASTEMLASIQEASTVADSLEEFVEQTATSVEEMIASLNEVAENTEQLAAVAVETSSTIVEMSSTTESIARNAQESADFSQRASEAAARGREAVRNTVDGMTQIESAVAEVRSAVTDLGVRSREIGEIVRVIEDIAKQTNLLALNAAIIAAQAGEQGAGFAVVADEIRDLSQRTSKSTDEIRLIIQRVQGSVGKTVEQMALTAQRVSDGVAFASGAEVRLESIIDLNSSSSHLAAQIAQATEEQLRGSRAAASAIETVTVMIHQTARSTVEQSKTSQEIGRQATTVRDYTKTLRKALLEEEAGSRAISDAIESMTTSINEVQESAAALGLSSAAIVSAMASVEQGARESDVVVSALNGTAATLRHGAGVLQAELRRFTLPEPLRGGEVTTATVLPDELTLDPLFQSTMAQNIIQKAVHETLVKFGEGAELLPGLAARWEVLEAGHVYRFHLRQNARFHNGRPVTSRDVEASLLRLMSPRHKSGGRYLVQDIRGAKDVIEGRSEKASGIVIRGTYTIDLVVDDAPAFFLMLLTLTKTAIVPVEEAQDLERFRLAPVGAGPYVVKEAIDGQRVVLVRNEDYFDPERPRVGQITYRLDFRTFQEFADAFLRGEVQIAHRLPLRLAAELRQDERFAPYLSDTVFQHTSYLGYDCSTAPFDRVEVRQAMNYAINRDRINERLFGGLSIPAQSLLPPGLQGYDESLRGFTYDPERARNLLRAGGYGNGFSVQYWMHENDDGFNSGQVPLIIEDLAAIGVRVEPVRASLDDAKRHVDASGHNSLFQRNWFADFPDADNFFWTFFHPKSTTIPGMNYRNDEMEKMIDVARHSLDLEQRAAIYRELNAKVVAEAPIAPLFHERFFLIHTPYVRGLRPSSVTPPVRYDRMWIDR